MTPKQLCELLEYIIENNGWQHLYSATRKGRKCFKYLDFSFDTRDGHIWQIHFRANGAFNLTEEKTFKIESDEDIKAIYAFLDEVYTKGDMK